MVIVFTTESGLAVVYPTPEFAERLDVVAKGAVPNGAQWAIVEKKNLPYGKPRSSWLWSDVINPAPPILSAKEADHEQA